MQLELLDDQPDGGTAVGDLLTPREVATRCKVSTKTVLRAIRGGRLRASRLGARGAYRVRPKDLAAWLDASTLTVPPNRQPATTPVSSTPIQGAGGRLAVTEGMDRRP